ncbi:esterase [Penicillium cosmopolitanum]|uniref:Esterase n=1 Tax=Penicillium cosmopolitanum TaxID=1131564 RepID=A0A9W9W160_9EURO|nr:esterase [Penicillium cosmopolitanum]KAJ5396607.1 esterase [Penicillium cosmopolitanum]
MDDVTRILDGFTDPTTGSLHGAIFVVIDSSGKTIYERTSGKASFEDGNSTAPQLDSLCWVASMTKLVTAVAIMQLVEQNLLSIDDDARDYVPELKGIQILRDDHGHLDTLQPRLEPVQGKLAIRHPLIFEPGTSWAYGAGIDWAGRVVECVSNSTLEDYMQENIWSKLGETSTTFHPERRRDTLPAALEMGYRVSIGHGSKSVKQGPITLHQPAKDSLGGIGLFSTTTDYVKLLAALLKGGAPILSRKGLDILFQPHLSEASRLAMPKSLGLQMSRILGINSVDDAGQADHCLAGTINLKDIPGRRKAGTVNWSGLPNLHWWIDPKTGIAATLFTQLMPPGDAAVTSLLIELEEATYRALADKVNSNSISPRL